MSIVRPDPVVHQLDQQLDAETSVMLSRRFLEALSGDPDMAAMIDDAWAQVMNDDNLFVGAIIAVGLMVNLTLFMVSSDIEIDLGKIKIHKGKVDTEAVRPSWNRFRNWRDWPGHPRVLRVESGF